MFRTSWELSPWIRDLLIKPRIRAQLPPNLEWFSPYSPQRANNWPRIGSAPPKGVSERCSAPGVPWVSASALKMSNAPPEGPKGRYNTPWIIVEECQRFCNYSRGAFPLQISVSGSLSGVKSYLIPVDQFLIFKSVMWGVISPSLVSLS